MTPCIICGQPAEFVTVHYAEGPHNYWFCPSCSARWSLIYRVDSAGNGSPTPPRRPATSSAEAESEPGRV